MRSRGSRTSLNVLVAMVLTSGTVAAQALPPVITKSFAAASITVNGTTTLTIEIRNPNNNVTLTNVDFTDNLPAGMVIAIQGGIDTCGGPGGAFSFAQLGGSTFSFFKPTLDPGAVCTEVVTVTGTTAGVKNNSVQGNSTNGGSGNTATAALLVTGIPATPAPSSLLLLSVGLLALMSFSGWRKLRQRRV